VGREFPKANEGTGKVVNIRTVDDLIAETIPGRATKGRTRQFEKSGGFNQSLDDFVSLNPGNVKDIPGGKTGILPDGRKINIRIDSSDGRPTLEIQDGKKAIKIRYNE